MEVLKLRIKKETTLRLVGVAEHGMRWSHTHMWEIKFGMNISGGVPDQHQAPQPRVPVPRKEVPITSDSKNHWELRQ